MMFFQINLDSVHVSYSSKQGYGVFLKLCMKNLVFLRVRFVVQVTSNLLDLFSKLIEFHFLISFINLIKIWFDRNSDKTYC